MKIQLCQAMSKDTNIVYSVCFFLLFALPVWGQQDSTADKSWGGVPDKIGTDEYRGRSLPYLREKAESNYQDQDYGRAAKFYSMILDARPKDTAALIGFANAAYRNTKYDTAAWACRVLIDSNLVDNKDGRIALLLADIYYCSGKFSSARLWYDYIEALPQASAATKLLAQTGLNKCAAAEAALEKMQMPGAKKIHIEPLPHRVRTRYSEYAPVWKGDSVLYYTAYGGFPYREDERVPVRRPMKMVIAEPATDTIAVRDAGINEENRHTAYTAFNTRDDAMYYAVGKNVDNHQIRFELYRRKRTGSGGWGLPERLPEKINLKKYTATQPHVAMLPGAETETLFFVSDRPGGKGGRDIWFCKIQNDTFTEPQNLSNLNTSGDDVSPFYYAADKILYFSSNGYPKMGMGGFDILQVSHTGQGWDTLVTALPPPLNSGANDLFYTRPDCSDMAFLSSNRNGAINFSDEDCCYDLFRVEMTKPEFLAVTFHEITKDSLPNTTMRLYDP